VLFVALVALCGFRCDCEPPPSPTLTTTPCEEVCRPPTTNFTCSGANLACCTCEAPSGETLSCKNNFSVPGGCP
jgi:hypothetical protein